MVESLDQLASALEGEDGEMNKSALRLRLSQQYVNALSKIYEEARLVVLPPSSESNSQSDAIVTGLALYK